MAQKTIEQLKAVNSATFGAGKDTLGDDEKAFNDDQLDSIKPLEVVISANKTAILGESYVLVASATFTDPSPVEGKGYTVFIRNGTATIGSVAYATPGTTITRIFHSGSWATYATFSGSKAFILDSESQPNTISSVVTAFVTGSGAIRNFIAPFANVNIGDNFTDNYVGNNAYLSKQGDGNIINGNRFGEVSITSMGNSCAQNDIGVGAYVTLGDGAVNNVIGAGSNSFTFGSNLRNVFVMPGTVGKDVTASPDYDFLYNNDFPSRIYNDNVGDLYHETCVAGVLTITLIP